MDTPKIELSSAISFTCKRCGVCCWLQPPDVDEKEQKRIEDSGFKNFCKADKEGIYWIKRKSDGSCLFLGLDNRCKIYAIRPAVCKLEPFTIVDFDFERNTVVLDQNYPFSCCCEGFNLSGVTSKKELSYAVQVIIRKILELTAQDMELPQSDVRVYSETRSRILRRNVELADLQL